MKIKVILALAGAATVLAGGAILYNYLNSQNEKKYGEFDIEISKIGKA